jgi:ABC-2 type transport system ATP-binding protein
MGVDSRDPRSRAHVGYMPEISYYPQYLKLDEFLHTCAALSGVPAGRRRAAVHSAAQQTAMTRHLDCRLSTFSKGMLQQAGFGQALLHNPSILILDEPMSGLDPIARMRMRALMSELRSEGKTILFSSHELGEIEMVADRILLMNEGRLVYQGGISQLVGEETNLEQAFVHLLGEELPWAA